MYILIFGFVWLFACQQSFRQEKANVKLPTILCFLLLVAHDGLRWAMGTDWPPYYNAFLGNVESDQYEIGYQTLQNLVASCTQDYTIFLIIHAVLIYSLYFFWLKKFVPKGFFTALLIFYTAMIGLLGMNRQHIALALCLASCPFLIDKRYIIFLLINFFAITFHNSAIVFMLIAWLATRNIKIKYCFIAMALAMLANQLKLTTPTYVWLTNWMGDSVSSKTEAYIAYEANRTIFAFLLFLLRRMAVLGLIWMLRKRLPWDNPYFKFSFIIYLFGLIISVAIDGELQFLQGRFSIYYLIFEAVLWGYIAWRTPVQYKLPVMVLVLVYAIFSFFRSINLYPDLFLPYKSIFWE